LSHPLARVAVAVVLLGVYYQTLFGGTPPAPTAVGESPAIRDIEDSQLAFSAGDYAGALEPTRRLTLQFPTQAMYFDRLARIQQKAGTPLDEARAWEGVFRTSPTPVDACPMMPAAYERIPDPARAIDAYERCVEADPDDPDLLLYLGRAYTAAGRAGPARAALEKALALAPEYPDVYLLLGVRTFADGQRQSARSLFERFVALAPERREEAAVWLERTKGAP
jgi:tetratricopeptide (TPR) repeat protein